MASSRRRWSLVGRELQPCGTLGAWKRHKEAGEYPCAECADAHRRYHREYNRRRREGQSTSTPKPPPSHGTIAGYRRHLADRERPCQDCRAANSEYQRAYHRRRKQREAQAAAAEQRRSYDQGYYTGMAPEEAREAYTAHVYAKWRAERNRRLQGRPSARGGSSGPGGPGVVSGG